MMKPSLVIFFAFCMQLDLSGQSNQHLRNDIGLRNLEFKSESVLARGNVKRTKVSTSGIYKITFDDMIAAGLQTGASISNLQLFSTRGGLIPESLEEDLTDDLVEIPFKISGNNESLDPGEFIYFYIEGADAFKTSSNGIYFEKNIYSDHNYLYLKQVNGNRIPFSEQPIVGGEPDLVSRNYLKNQRYEEDETNLLGQFTSTQGSGKDWYGDYFNLTLVRSYENKFDFTDRVENSMVQVKLGFAGRDQSAHNVSLRVGDNTQSFTINGVNTGNLESQYAHHLDVKEVFYPSNISFPLSLELDDKGNNEGWLDYIEINSRHELKYRDEQLIITPEANGPEILTQIQITSGKNLEIWNVSDPLHPESYSSTENNGMITTQQYISQDEIWTLFAPDDLPDTSWEFENIQNQNIHSLQSAEMIILYHPDFEIDALRLATHRINSGLEVIAVNVNKVYHEFAGGKKDLAGIRNFIKMMYDRSPSLRYLLLFGDASYDYKNLTPGLNDQNFIPTYETEESLHPIEAFPSDDFYGLLSDRDGGDLRGQLEIAVGRLPVKTPQEAKIVVDKIIRYESDPLTLGSWRLNVGFTADDEDFNTHFNQSERIASASESKFPLFNQQKVYFDAFPQVSTAGGARYPEAAARIDENIFNGQLVLNYLGHGGPRGWAQERVLKVNDILSWDNYYKLPLLITATCSFTGYDDPGLVSAGEHALLSANGGAIALFTTVRAVYSNDNFRLTAAVFDTLFTTKNNRDLSIGDIMIRSKNQNWQDTTRVNARKFALIGDPALNLAVPYYNIEIDEINGSSITTFTDTINALDEVEISGSIRNIDGTLNEAFNGTLFPTVYDKKSRLKTLRNDSRSRADNFEILNSILFKGTSTIQNGQFTFRFIVPKDINYAYGKGKISLYAISDQHEDASGFYNEMIIGGASDVEIVDNEGPQIEAFMNDFHFVDGGITEDDPTLLLRLSDLSGINVAGNSIGHDLTVTIDNDPTRKINLNSFFISEENNFRIGTVSYPLSDLEPGGHTLLIKAWDLVNNSSEKTLNFEVITKGNDKVINLMNYPNPFSGQTTFSFEHTWEGRNTEVTLSIYDTAGRLVKILRQGQVLTGYRKVAMDWENESGLGNNLPTGTYIYQVNLRDLDTNESILSNWSKMMVFRN